MQKFIDIKTKYVINYFYNKNKCNYIHNMYIGIINLKEMVITYTPAVSVACGGGRSG